MLAEIEKRLKTAEAVCRRLSYVFERVSAKEFYDYVAGDTFSGDTTTIHDVLDSEYLMIHELVEVSELKRMGRKINKHTIMKSPKMMIYTAHFAAMEFELNCALARKDYSWIKVRLKQHKESVLDADPYLPESLRPRGEELFEEFSSRMAESARAR